MVPDVRWEDGAGCKVGGWCRVGVIVNPQPCKTAPLQVSGIHVNMEVNKHAIQSFYSANTALCSHRNTSKAHPVARTPCEEHKLDHRVHENHILDREGNDNERNTQQNIEISKTLHAKCPLHEVEKLHG